MLDIADKSVTELVLENENFRYFEPTHVLKKSKMVIQNFLEVAVKSVSAKSGV